MVVRVIGATERAPQLLASLDASERRRWQAELERHQHACGCAEATVGLFVAVAVVGLCAWAGWLPGAWWQASLVWLWVVLAGAVIGKLAGKARGRRRAHRLLTELAELVAQRHGGRRAP